jgi:hypothetical protein
MPKAVGGVAWKLYVGFCDYHIHHPKGYIQTACLYSSPRSVDRHLCLYAFYVLSNIHQRIPSIKLTTLHEKLRSLSLWCQIYSPSHRSTIANTVLSRDAIVWAQNRNSLVSSMIYLDPSCILMGKAWHHKRVTSGNFCLHVIIIMRYFHNVNWLQEWLGDCVMIHLWTYCGFQLNLTFGRGSFYSKRLMILKGLWQRLCHYADITFDIFRGPRYIWYILLVGSSIYSSLLAMSSSYCKRSFFVITNFIIVTVFKCARLLWHICNILMLKRDIIH